jgi:hypothetical protein
MRGYPKSHNLLSIPHTVIPYICWAVLNFALLGNCNPDLAFVLIHQSY